MNKKEVRLNVWKNRLLRVMVMGMRLIVLSLMLSGGLSWKITHAQPAGAFLDPVVAFKLSAKLVDTKTISIRYQIADGYYMYRERFQFNATGAILGTAKFPSGKIKFDETFRKDVETYRDNVTILVPVESPGAFTLTIVAQGCAEQGLCYAPMTSRVRFSPDSANPVAIDFNVSASESPASLSSSLVGAESGSDVNGGMNVGANAVVSVNNSSGVNAPAGANAAFSPNAQSQNIGFGTILKSGNFLRFLPLFFLLGLGLAFTPCVLPMVPILSSIIVGEGNLSRGRSFFLAIMYSLGMALVYTAFGVTAGLVGEGLAAYLQAPLVLGAFAAMMVVFALSMLGVITLRMPAFIETRITQMSQNRRAGKNLGVFVMGALSAVLVGPCVVSPLAAALVYISQTRNVVVGGSALFALAIGMSVPLLLVGLSAGTLLPRAGAWMKNVQHFFGVLILGVALSTISPLLPLSVEMAFWAALGIGYGAFLLWSTPPGWIVRALGVTVLALGMAQLVGVASGATDILRPLAHLTGAKPSPLVFQRIASSEQLDTVLAKNTGKTVLLDFYADWCVACKEMKKYTFVDAGIHQQLTDTILLQADVTGNTAQDRALLKRFQLFGPPGIILFNGHGQEIANSRIIGYQNAAQFSRSIAVLKVP